MSATGALIIAFALWGAIGLFIALLMGRRGHHPWTWAVAGVVLGPLVAPVAVSLARNAPKAYSRVLGDPARGPGPVDVLVGIDGSTLAARAARVAVQLLDERIGRLTLVSAVDYETVSMSPVSTRDVAEEELKRVAAELEPLLGRTPGTALVAGPPVGMLADFAAREGYALIAIGARGTGASRYAFGSVASALARRGSLPTLVVHEVAQ
jgi:nucleotide-binding universal stress UspA family protein